MRKIIAAAITAAALLASATAHAQAPAAAAPVPTKAPSAIGSSVASPYGWYVGLGSAAALASASTSGIFPSGLTADGGVVSVDFGYIKANCILGSPCQFEGDFRYQNISGSNANGSLSSQWSATQEIDVGLNAFQYLSQAFGNLGLSFPSFNPSTLVPAGLQNSLASTPQQFVGFKIAEFDMGGTFGSGSGRTVFVAPGVTTNYRFQVLNSSGVPTGTSLKVFADVLWATKGLVLTGLFAGPGITPSVMQSNLGYQTIFEAGFNYDFGLGSSRGVF